MLAFVKAHWGLILTISAFIVNNLINALTAYPQAETWLHALSDLFAWASHYDSQGTYKVPGTRSKPPSGIHPYRLGKRGGSGTTMILPLVLLAIVLPGCCKVGSKCAEVESAAEFCAKGVAAAQGPHLLPIIEAILRDVLITDEGAVYDVAELAQTLGSDGRAIVDCVIQQLQGKMQAEAKAGRYTATPSNMALVRRADLWLARAR